MRTYGRKRVTPPENEISNSAIDPHFLLKTPFLSDFHESGCKEGVPSVESSLPVDEGGKSMAPFFEYPIVSPNISNLEDSSFQSSPPSANLSTIEVEGKEDIKRFTSPSGRTIQNYDIFTPPSILNDENPSEIFTQLSSSVKQFRAGEVTIDKYFVKSMPSASSLLPGVNKKSTASRIDGKLQKISRNRLHDSVISSKKMLVQSYLDLGQKNFDTISCKTCGMTYCPGIDDDEHNRHCRLSSKQILYINGWIGENVVKELSSQPLANSSRLGGRDSRSRIIRVSLGDDIWNTRKFQDILALLNDELGIESSPLHRKPLNHETAKGADGLVLPEDSSTIESLEPVSSKPFHNVSGPGFIHAFLYISDSLLKAAVLVEEKHNAFPLLPERVESPVNCSSAPSEMILSRSRISGSSIPVQMGVAQIWTHPSCRSKGLARELLDAARYHSIYSHVIPLEAVAFSQPTSSGFALAKSYIGSEIIPVY